MTPRIRCVIPYWRFRLYVSRKRSDRKEWLHAVWRTSSGQVKRRRAFRQYANYVKERI